ncbi:unnamed protein product [Medioppia subpectinata]|uniref:Uncharacterized protein n=1 Tax=Medioppia subpectinata TaxID=1979941 RepID=A0A7R9KEG9_9ACAR|nr:unnamed protein product [Medioppia subpectinata]CAG2100646.1 unnamed protein product [Medioppia subpectinata]
MVYTLIAITVAAIVCGESVDPTIGAIGTHMTTDSTGVDNTDLGYNCDQQFLNNFADNIRLNLTYCLSGDLWAPGAPAPDFTDAINCCYHYDLNRVVKPMYDKECRKVSDKYDSDVRKMMTNCTANGHQLSDSFCAGLTGKRPMSPECQMFITGLANRVVP